MTPALHNPHHSVPGVQDGTRIDDQVQGRPGTRPESARGFSSPRRGVGIIGTGFVGQAMLKLFGDCPVYDPAKGKTDKEAINHCRFTFVCVPTPTGPQGKCDTSIVEEVCRWIESEFIIIRSTVAPGTTDRLKAKTGKRIIFQPEYIGETAAHPLLDPRHRASPSWADLLKTPAPWPTSTPRRPPTPSA